MSSATIAPFEKVPNFRDIGITVGHSSLRPGLLFRSAAPDDATAADKSRLASEVGLKTIIDLRSDTEHQEVTKKHASKVPPAPDPPGLPSHIDRQYPFRIAGVNYELINFNGSAYSGHLIKQLSYLNVAKLFTWYTLGWRTDAISIIGSNVMQKRGLIGLAQDSLELCKKEVKLVFNVLAKQTSYPLLVHCTQGKDRTGLVVLLTLLLLGVNKEDIKRDYILSEEGLASDKQERVKAIAKIGLGEEFAGCPDQWVDSVVETIEQSYGGVAAYLTRCGVDQEQQAKVKEVLATRSA
ncbi:Putative tyrosine-specific protein phosphatase [Septoria linicola]|uniref:Tyrosine-specific protein phosphatase n=1 Tax=Septoria linicola TaxID=215465 RepID=A0A9Q9EP09_9PEZI|nr:putative tyrosine-specific protein phosphatase [Septoria linicola]USW57615.1 Putative tyrosine-specific protein phosphatase [Septoria linicola]